MDRNEIMEKIITLIVTCKDQVDANQINENTNLIKDYMFDSVNLIDLLCMLENEFDIEIDDEYLDQSKISVVGSLCDIVESLVGR